MKSVRKKLLYVLLFVLIMSTFSLFVNASVSGTAGNNITYVLDDDGNLTISGKDSMKNWRGSSSSPWEGSSKVVNVIIEEGVTSIGDFAFYECGNIENITIPSSVTYIGEGSFYGCENLKNVYLSDIKSWCSISFLDEDDNPLYYAENLFLNNDLVTDLIIPDGAEKINRYAFNNYTKLESITLGDSVTEIGICAFDSCTGLTSVTIGENVTQIRSYAFNNCIGLTSVTIGENVTQIGSYAFNNCIGLTSVIVPDSVTSMGTSVFGGCTSLKEITLPFVGSSRTSYNSDSAVFGYLFDYVVYSGSVDNLDAVFQFHYDGYNERYYYYYIPETLKKVTITDATAIPFHAFYNCSGLTSITIPASVTKIGGAAFYNCKNLTKVNITDLAAWCKIEFEDLYANPLKYSNKFYLNDNLVTNLVIPDGVTNISDYSFSNCTNLTSVIIPNSVTSIGDYSFSGCTKLSSVVIPDSVTNISNNAFNGCNSLKDVYFYGTIDQWKSTFAGTGNEKFSIHYDVKAVINYDANGGTNAPYFQVINQGESGFVVSDKVPVKDGYGFLGWSTTSDGTVEFYPGDECQIAEDMFLYAVWVKTYNISYYANGGYGAPSLQKKAENVELTLSDQVPTRVGYDFIGWAQKKSSNTLKNLSVSGKESSHNYEDNSNKTWTISCSGANSISITFDPLTEFETNYDYLYIFDGSGNQIGKYSGTELSGKTIVVNDDYVSLRLTSDYSNTKWGFSVTEAVASITETSIGNVEYLPGDIYTINEPLSLYAVWETKIYHISFDANGGTGAPLSQTKTYGTNLTLSSVVPVREGYNFLGWSDSPAATSASYNAGGIYTDTSDEDVTLYAVWQLKTYTVFYNANGGSSVPSSQTKGYFDDLVLATPTRTGYTFKGWSTSYGGNVVYTSGSTYTTNQNLILYAVWEINKYTVSYNANGGTGASSSQNKTYGTTITLSNILFAREGYNFLGWSTNRNGNIESKKSLSVSGLESAHNYANNTNKSWTVLSSGAQSIQLIFDSRTEFENNYDKLYIYDRNNIQVGIYTGTQLAGKTITVDGDKVVLKLVSDPSQNRWGFKVTSAYAIQEKLYEPGDSYTITSDVVFYAIWQLKTYSVNYNANGGIRGPSSQTKKYFDNLVLSSSVPTRTGYTFKGWARTADGEVEFHPGDIYTANEAMTLYAVWEVKKYIVSYDANGGVGTPENQEKTYDIDITLSTLVPEREGYNFKGWSKSSTSTSASYSAGSIYTDNSNYVDVTLYAVWIEKTYSVTYNSNGGSNTPDPQSKYYFSDLALRTNIPTKTNYVFVGWSTTSNGKVEYLPGDIYTSNEPMTLYAKWVKKDGIAFDGVTNAVAGQEISYDVYVSSNYNLDYLISTIKYPKHFTVKEIVNKAFEDNTIETQYFDDEYNYITIICTFDFDGERTQANKGYIPCEIVFGVAENCPLGTHTISFSEGTIGVGDEDYPLVFEEVSVFVPDTLTIYGDDEISDESQYTVRGVNSIDVPVVWTVDDKTVATISEDGVLTPIVNGTVVITATYTENNTIFATKTVTIKDNDVTAIDIIGADTVYDGEKYAVKLYPESLNHKIVTWSVDDETIATITEDGVLTAISAGAVNVTATVNDATHFSKSITVTIPSINSVIDSLSADVGTWDKEFVPYERNYTVTVPTITQSISFTGLYSSGSLKCDGLVLMNGRAKTIALSEDVTTLTFERGDVSGKNDSEYVITVIKKHYYGDWTVITEPTCTEDGEKKIVCTVCGDVKATETIPELGHIWSDWEEIKAPTYYESGIETRTCGVCGETDDRVVVDQHFADRVEFTPIKTTSLAVGKYLTLKATASRTDGLKPQSTAVTYEIIEGKDLATIDAKGKLTAKAVGEVVVRATAEFGTEEAYAEVTINVCIPATKVTLNTTKASMIVDGTLKLKATMTPANNTDTITWFVDKEEVATVDENGVVTAHKAGKVKVTAMAESGKSAYCSITIGEPATKVELTGLKSTSLALGKSITLKAKAACEGKTKPVSTAVVFEIIEGEDIATLDAKGKLTAKGLGEVTVRARAEAGTADAYADVTINICIPATKVKLNMTKASMIVGGEDLYLSAEISPEDNTDTLTWSVDKEDIAAVDENGVVTALKAGKVKVTAMTGSGKKATCTVTIGEPATKVVVTALKTTSVAVGKSITLKGKAACEGKIKPVSTAVVFDIIEGDDIATIDAKGKLTAKAEGTVVVRISAEAGTEDAYEDVEIRICNLATKVTLNMTKATIAVDDELQLEATMTAKGECTDTLTWSVDKPNIATVDENGLVTAHSAGKVKVTVTSGSGKKATCTVTVAK